VELEARLIDDLLDLTRITQDKLELHLSVCELHSLLASAISVCRPEADAKELEIRTHFAAESQWLNADPARLQQVFWNLVKNAVKFTPPAGTVTVCTSNQVEDGTEYLVVKVADTGIGMSEEVQGKLFNVFEQGGRWITRTFGGLGLGLAISRKIVERHAGRITGESQGPGKGSVFTVRLPTVPAPESKSSRPKKPAAETPPLRILLVEDHPMTAKAIERLLREAGHEVRAAGTVACALKTGETQEFDLVISDLGLPDGDGTDMMRKLRDRHALGGIAVSGFGVQDDINRSAEAGFVAHLIKPITAEQLKHAIADAWETLSHRAAPIGER
jgi:CheY-like chemotaxis protein